MRSPKSVSREQALFAAVVPILLCGFDLPDARRPRADARTLRIAVQSITAPR
ncbi:hypothetical protein [Caulobacter sp. SSI4214]|uniref:hypothetical protein n=1 Tax=Caulobacter sp. SSI4214 TaxID=2575739 RepID=UPI00143C37C5|nr:hypothetical protein [Caulobacter sp. SSI4214]